MESLVRMCRRKQALTLAVVATAFSACGGGGSTSRLTPAVPNAPSAPTTTAHFRIVVPAQALKVVRSPKYVSASTQSVIITLATVNGKAYASSPAAPASIATNLTPASSACSMSGGGLVCNAAASAVAGSDGYTVTTYDAQQTGTS